MRVWALASCGGLLALAACSAEQSNTPSPSAAPPDGDDAAQVTARARATAPSPTNRPTVRPGQGRARLSPPVARPTSTAAQPPVASQLQARVQRLRAQQGSPLAASTPVTAAASSVTSTPLYSSLKAPTPESDRPQPSPAGFSNSASTPAGLAAVPGAVPSLQPPLPLPTAAAGAETSTPLNSTTTDLGPGTTADLARSYPIAPLRHQGHSSLAQPRVALTAAATPAFTTARVHGSTAPSAISSPEAPALLAESPEVATAPIPPQSAVSTARISSPSDSSAAVVAPGLATPHQSRGSIALTLGDRGSDSLAPDDGAGAHQSRGADTNLTILSAPGGAGAEARPTPAAIAGQSGRAIALPESLPLNSDSPRLSPPRPSGGNSPQGETSLQAEPAAVLGQSAIAEQDAAIAAPVASTGGHLSQADLETLELAPTPGENPKNLVTAHCLTADTVPLPKFSPSNQPDSSLSLGANPAEDELAAALCQIQQFLNPTLESALKPAPALD